MFAISENVWKIIEIGESYEDIKSLDTPVDSSAIEIDDDVENAETSRVPIIKTNFHHRTSLSDDKRPKGNICRFA